jgi:hypothetical protein
MTNRGAAVWKAVAYLARCVATGTPAEQRTMGLTMAIDEGLDMENLPVMAPIAALKIPARAGDASFLLALRTDRRGNRT